MGIRSEVKIFTALYREKSVFKRHCKRNVCVSMRDVCLRDVFTSLRCFYLKDVCLRDLILGNMSVQSNIYV